MAKHQWFHVVIVIVTVLTTIVSITISAISASPLGQKSGLFLNTNVEISDEYFIEITPNNWTFSIWGFIYTWQCLWLIYAVVTLFRKTENGEYFYQRYNLLPNIAFLAYIVTQIGNMVWSFMFDRQLVGWSLAPIACIPISLYVALIVTHRRLHMDGTDLLQNGYRKDVWLVRILVHNGLAIYATWTSVATLLNLAIMLVYRAGVDMETACRVSLGILIGLVVLLASAEITVFERYARYTFIHYLTLIFALSGVISKNYDSPVTTMTFTLLGIAIGFALSKMALLVYRKPREPLLTEFDRVTRSEVELAPRICRPAMK